MSAHKFRLTFKNGLTCTVTFDPAIHWNREAQRVTPAKHWHPKPDYKSTKAIFSEYLEWMHTVNAQIAQIIKADHRYVVTDSHAKKPTWEAWIYHADGTKECVAKGEGVFNPHS